LDEPAPQGFSPVLAAPTLTSGQLALRSVEARATAVTGSGTQAIDQCPTPAVDLSNCLGVRDRSTRLLPTLSIELVQFIQLAQESSYLDLAFVALGTVAGIHPHHLLRPMDTGSSSSRACGQPPVYVPPGISSLARVVANIP
jgi:hypothetical protein